MNISTNFTVDGLLTSIPQSGILYTLPAYDSIFDTVHQSDKITRPNSWQVNDQIEISLEEISDWITDNDDEDEDIYQSSFLVVPHCHVVGMLPFSNSMFSSDISPTALEHASSIALALQHLNTGDSSIISSLGNLRESSCSEIAFTLEFVDTEDNPGVTIDEVFNVTERTIEKYGYRTPCSFVGAFRSAVTIPAALLTGHKGYMEVSGSSTGTQLDDRDQYPNFGRTIPPDHENVIPIMNYLVNVLKLEYLAVVSMNEAFGNSFVESLQLESEKTIGSPRIYRITIDSSGDGISAALNELKNTQYRYILAVMPNMAYYDRLLEAAYNMGLAGKGTYQWFFADSFQGQRGMISESLQLAYNHTGVFKPSAGRLNNNTKYNEFVTQLNNLSMSREDMEYIRGIIPQDYNSEQLFTYLNSCNSGKCGNNTPDNENGNNNNNDIVRNIDTTSDFHDFSAFMYDATIAMGISACLAIGLNNGVSFGAASQYSLLTQRTRFYGATGNVIFSKKTGSRTYNSTYYQLINYVNEELIDVKTGKKRIVHLMNTAAIYHEGEWSKGEKAFVYSNGITDPPDSLPPQLGDYNYPTYFLRGVALFFCVFSIVMAIGFGVWTWFNRSTRVIQASQPFFLYLICAGVIMVATSIIPFSIDDEHHSQSSCNRACIAVFWLLFPGLSVVFSALFTKTYRINLIMKHSKKFRRVKVTIRQTLVVMAVMLICEFTYCSSCISSLDNDASKRD